MKTEEKKKEKLGTVTEERGQGKEKEEEKGDEEGEEEEDRNRKFERFSELVRHVSLCRGLLFGTITEERRRNGNLSFSSHLRYGFLMFPVFYFHFNAFEFIFFFPISNYLTSRC